MFLLFVAQLQEFQIQFLSLFEGFDRQKAQEVAILTQLGSKFEATKFGIPKILVEFESGFIMAPVLQKIDILFASHVHHLFEIVTFIHDQRILHRDIRPENLRCKSGQLYLIDFGFAIQFGSQVPFAGALKTASTKVLNSTAGNPINYEKTDDYSSAIKVANFCFSPSQKNQK